MNTKEIVDTLMSIGFTEGESKVYVAVVALGTSTVGPIIDQAEVSTSKIYLILEKLIAKGLVSIHVENEVKYYTSTNPDSILDFLKNEQERIRLQEEKIKGIVPVLREINKSKSTKPPVEMLKGKFGFKNAVDEMIDAAEKESPFFCLVGQRVSFAMQSLWKDFSIKTDAKKIPQVSTYEYSTWYKKDPSIHRRTERKFLYPKVLEEEYSGLPYILVLGNATLIADLENDQVQTFLIRNKMLSEAFTKLLKVIRNNGKLPEEYNKSSYDN